MKVNTKYQAIFDLLNNNQNTLVGEIMPQVVELLNGLGTARASNASTSIRDEAGNVIAIFCYYHKKWEMVSEAAYGAKKSTNTGLNTMCKIGVNMWTKQNRLRKQAEVDLLNEVAKGNIDPSEIRMHQQRIADEAKIIVARPDGHGYDTEEEVANHGTEQQAEPEPAAEPEVELDAVAAAWAFLAAEKLANELKNTPFMSKKARKAMKSRVHPDKVSGLGDAELTKAYTEYFQELNK